MLIEKYDLAVFTPPCEPGAERFSAVARLTTDIREVLPYLNATLRWAIYDANVPALRVFAFNEDGQEVNNLTKVYGPLDLLVLLASGILFMVPLAWMHRRARQLGY